MSRLIEELHLEHGRILEALEGANRAGLDTPAGRQELAKARSLLLAHLDKEDLFLYPKLRQRGAAEPAVAQLLAVFGDDLAEVTRLAVAFFDSIPSSRGLRLGRSFGTLIARLKLRISAEESDLYAAFDRPGA